MSEDEGALPSISPGAQAPGTPGSSPESSIEGLPLSALSAVVIPGYKLSRIIHRSGQSIVLKAVQQRTGRTVAIALIPYAPSHDIARERLKHEISVLAALNHPHIVSVIDSGQASEGDEFLVMRYVSGRTLDEYAREAKDERGHPEASTLLQLFSKVCDAVNAAHMCGIAHLSLNGSSILIDNQNEPHVTGFGLVHSGVDSFLSLGMRDISKVGQSLGKVEYASPEQVQGPFDRIDIRSDVYSLGVVLYQLFADGRLPYECRGAIQDVLKQIIDEPPAPLNIMRDGGLAFNLQGMNATESAAAAATLEAIVMKALSKDPSERYQSAAEFGRDIESLLHGQPTVAGRARAKTWIPGVLRELAARLARLFRPAQSVARPPAADTFLETGAVSDVVPLKTLYDSLPNRSSLPDWDTLTQEEKYWIARKAIEAAVRIPKDPSRMPVSLVIDRETVAIFQRVPALMERLVELLSGPPWNPPPANGTGNGGSGDENELRQIWLSLTAESKAILRFIWINDDKLLTYSLIAANLVVPKLPGDESTRERKDDKNISDKTVAERCRPMQEPPLLLIQRPRPRSGIQLTPKGDRLVRLHPRKNFS